MGLVDYEQADPLREHREHLGAELGVVEPFRRDEQQVDVVGFEVALDLGPGIAVRGVHGVGAQAEPLRGSHLVAHEGK